MARMKVDERYSYIFRYIKEAVESRDSLRVMANRSVLAYKGYPSRNYYKEAAAGYVDYMKKAGDSTRYELAKSVCDGITTEKNMTVFNAIETLTSMAMGGAEQFEYEAYDSFLEKDADLVERLSSLAAFFHEDNKIDALSGPMVRNLGLQGSANFIIKPVDKKNRFKLTMIDAFDMLKDPLRAKCNRDRFIGFTQMEHWSEVKSHVKGRKGGQLVSINEVDTYLEQVQSYLSPNAPKGEFAYAPDLDLFYAPYLHHRSESKNKKGETVNPADNIGYKGDDIERAYIYDLDNDMYFEVINRRFIIVAKENPLKTSVTIETYGKPDKSGKPSKKKVSREVSLDHPFIVIPFIHVNWETFPISPLFYALDEFDKIASMESVMNHNFSVMAPITFVGSSYDAERMSKASAVAGEIVEGTLNTIGVMNKAHDMSPVLAAIDRKEERIKRMLGATDQYELQAMIGNRASAAEVSSATGAVSQRLNPLLANIETGISEMIQKLFDMAIIYGEDDTFSFPHLGKYSEATKEDMMGNSIIRARLKSLVKLEQQNQSRNALQVMGYIGSADYIDKKNFISTMLPIAMQGIVSRKQAESFVNEEYRVDPTMLKLHADKRDKLTAQREQSPVGDVDMDGLTDADIAEMEAYLAQSMAAGGQQTDVAQMMGQSAGMAQMMGQPDTSSAALPVAEAPVPQGTDPYDAGTMANEVVL